MATLWRSETPGGPLHVPVASTGLTMCGRQIRPVWSQTPDVDMATDRRVCRLCNRPPT